MKSGLEEFLKRIEAKPTNETLIDRFMTLVLEEEGEGRILYLKSLVGILLKANPYAALKAAYVELQEARKEHLNHEYEIGALKDVESCFLNLGKAENAAIIREEIAKLQLEYAKSKGVPQGGVPIVPSPSVPLPGGQTSTKNASAAAAAPQGSAAQAFFASLANKVKGKAAPQPPLTAPPPAQNALSNPLAATPGPMTPPPQGTAIAPLPVERELDPDELPNYIAPDDYDSVVPDPIQESFGQANGTGQSFSLGAIENSGAYQRGEAIDPILAQIEFTTDTGHGINIRHEGTSKSPIDPEEAEQNRLRAEAEAKALAEIEGRIREQQEALAKMEAEEKQRREIEEKLREEAEAEAKARAELEARLRREAEEKLRLEAEERARLEAEEMAKLEAEAKALAEREEKARMEALAKAEAEERARKEDEEKARIEMVARLEAEAKAKIEAEAKAQQEAFERAEAEARLRAKAEAEAKVRAETEARLRAEAEAKIRIEAEVKAKAEAEARLRLEIEEKVRAEAEAKARADAEAKAQIQIKPSFSIPNAADEAQRAFAGNPITQTKAHGTTSAPATQTAPLATKTMPPSTFDSFENELATRVASGMVIGTVQNPIPETQGFAPLATAVAVGLPNMLTPAPSPAFLGEMTIARPKSLSLNMDEVKVEAANPQESEAIAFAASQASPALEDEVEGEGEFGLSLEYTKRNRLVSDTRLDDVFSLGTDEHAHDPKQHTGFSLKDELLDDHDFSRHGGIDEAFEPQPFFQPDDDEKADDLTPPPSDRTMQISLEKLDESRDQMDMAQISSSRVQNVRMPVNSGPNFVILDDDDTEVTKIDAPVYAAADEVTGKDLPQAEESPETLGEPLSLQGFGEGLEKNLSLTMGDDLNSPRQEQTSLPLSETPVSAAPMPLSQLFQLEPDEVKYVPDPLPLEVGSTHAVEPTRAEATNSADLAPKEPNTTEASFDFNSLALFTGEETPKVSTPALNLSEESLGRLLSLANAKVEKTKHELGSTEQWSRVRSALGDLSGAEHSKVQLTDFLKRLYQVKTETPRIQKVQQLLTRFLGSQPLENDLKQQISAWLFEDLEPGALHELFETMNLKTELLDLFLDHLHYLADRWQQRLALSLMHDVLRFELDESWYVLSYPLLQKAWSDLGVEGWNWLPEEGGSIFCDRLARREEPYLQTLLA